MNDKTKTPEPERPANKATMDQPQEEFIDDQNAPSHHDADFDRDHGAEVEQAKEKHAHHWKQDRAG